MVLWLLCWAGIAVWWILPSRVSGTQAEAVAGVMFGIVCASGWGLSWIVHLKHMGVAIPRWTVCLAGPMVMYSLFRKPRDCVFAKASSAALAVFGAVHAAVERGAITQSISLAVTWALGVFLTEWYFRHVSRVT